MKARSYWVIQDPEGDFLTFTFNSTRSECINWFVAEEHEGIYRPWFQLKKRGYRCVKVRIQEIKK